MHWIRLVATLLVGSVLVSCGPQRDADLPTLVEHPSSKYVVPVPIVDATEVLAEWPTENEIRSAFAGLVDRRRDCGRRPTRCEESSLAVDGSDVHRRLVDLMHDRRAHDIVASDRGGLRLRIDAIEVLGSDRARVLTCIADDTVLVQYLAIDGVVPVPVVVDDSLFSSFTWWTIERHDGRWLWVDEDGLQWTIGADLCAG